MYSITKRIEIAAAHKLDLPYESPCQRIHGHNWIITVEVSSEELDECGMVIDFKMLKQIMEKVIKEKYDHRNISGLFDINPTAEIMASVIAADIQNELCTIDLFINGEGLMSINVTKVTVQESEGNIACYIP